ncbi:hypothetical protein Tco_0508589 [Tanacetum coccineum]
MRNVRFNLRYENKEYVLDEQILTINDDSTQQEIEAHQKHDDDANKEKASKECLDVVKSLIACKQKPGASICAFVLEMKGYFDILESLNMVFDAELSINIIISGIKKIDVPSTSAAHVLTVGHNAKKRKTSHSNWKGKSDRGSREMLNLRELKDGKVEKGSHTGLKESRRLKHGELNLVMRNRKIMLKSKVGIDLNNDKISDSTLSELDEHANYKEAMASQEAAKCKEAMKSEIQSMYDN